MKFIYRLLFCFILAPFTQAALPADAGSGDYANCSLTSASVVTCTGNVTIANNSQISLTQDLTWLVTGNLTLQQNVKINLGSSFGLTLQIGGNLDASSNGFEVVADINVGNDAEFGQNAQITGNLDIGGDVDFEQNTRITGDTYVQGDAIYDQNVTIDGTTFVAGSAVFGQNAVVNGNITALGDLTFGTNTTIDSTATCSASSGNYLTYCTNTSDVVPSAGLCFDFESGVPSNWITAGTGESGTNTATFQSAGSSLYLRRTAVTITTQAFNLTTASNAELSIWVRAGFNAGDNNLSNPSENGEDLQLEYRDEAGDWNILETYLGVNGSSDDGEIFIDSFILPTDALHAATEFRLNKIDGSGGTGTYDYWHIDDLCLTPDSSNLTLSANPVVEYRFDEDSWDGTTGEVIDSSGNNAHATANAASATTTTTESVICNAASFNGTNQYISSDYLNTLAGTSSLSFWIKLPSGYTSSTTNPAISPSVIGIENPTSAQDIFWGFIDNNGFIGVSKSAQLPAKSTTAVNDNTYHHVLLTRDSVSLEANVYIDGQLERTLTTRSGLVTELMNSIGRVDRSAGTNYQYINALVDELSIYDRVLTANDAALIYDLQLNGLNLDGTTRDCVTAVVTTPDHFSFDHDGSGIHCAAETITLTARQSDGTALETYTGTVNLTTSTTNGDWSYSGAGTFTAGAGNTGSAAVEFITTDLGQVTLSYANTFTETLSFNADDSGVSETSGSATTTPLDDDPDMSFAAAGFIFLDASTNNVISELNLIAAAANSTRVRAVTTDPTTGVCLPLFANASTATINTGTNCTNPNSCVAGEQVLWSNGTTANETLPNPENLESGLDTKDLSVLFSSNATADVDLTTTDLGEMDLTLIYELTDADGNKTGETVEGTLPLNSRPAALQIENIFNGTTENDGTNVFATASEQFTAAIQALDANGDVLPSLGRVVGLYDIDWSLTTLAGPAGAPSLGALTGDTLNQSSSSQWQGTDTTSDGYNDAVTFITGNSLTYGEVGQINLIAQITNFMGFGFPVNSETTPELTGRFVPSYLQVTQDTSGGEPSWGSNTSAYQGRTETLENTSFTITAYDINGTPVNYYDGSAFNLSLPNADSLSKQAADTLKGGDLESATTWSLADNNDFNGSVTLNATSTTVLWPRNLGGVTENDELSTIDGFDISALTFTDSDGICHTLTGTGCELVTVDIESNSLYYARVTLPEQVNASSLVAYVPLTLEYLSEFNSGEQTFEIQITESDFDSTIIAGLNFVTGDVCSVAGCDTTGTTIANSADGTLSDNIGSGTTLLSGLGQLQASSASEISGIIEVELEIPAWLYWNWGNTGINGPASTYLLFGNYQGRSPILFTRPGYR